MKNNKELEKTSRFLSLVLRHEPERIGLVLDSNGWANVDQLLHRLEAHGHAITLDQLREVVDTSDKKRFALSGDERRIRANQGHSIREVDLKLQPQVPPVRLFHGTADRFLESIRMSGLKPLSRNHVHLSADVDVAVNVGRRHGKPLVLMVSAAAMAAQGHLFYLSDNGVWLTEFVGPEFIEIPGDGLVP
jgi:putative RNA 2'-phosphotransferase